MTNNLSYNNIDGRGLVQNAETNNYIAQNDFYQRYQNNYQMFPTTIDTNYENTSRNIEEDNNANVNGNVNNYSCMYEKNNLLTNEDEKVDYNYNPTINVSWIGQTFGNSVSPTLTEL